MDEFDRYKYLLGETIMLYQFMENDLKLIYAGMQEGNFYKNIELVRANCKGLGQVVKSLEDYDLEYNENQYFDSDTYTLLNKLARQRNYYCHQCCVEFAYAPDFINSVEFKDALKSLTDTNRSLKQIQVQTQKHRVRVLEKYNRI